jgi:hypothetical protein
MNDDDNTILYEMSGRFCRGTEGLGYAVRDGDRTFNWFGREQFD